jgi:hypothetical protein
MSRYDTVQNLLVDQEARIMGPTGTGKSAVIDDPPSSLKNALTKECVIVH